jgi:hypothetical protein
MDSSTPPQMHRPSLPAPGKFVGRMAGDAGLLRDA